MRSILYIGVTGAFCLCSVPAIRAEAHVALPAVFTLAAPVMAFTALPTGSASYGEFRIYYPDVSVAITNTTKSNVELTAYEFNGRPYIWAATSVDYFNEAKDRMTKGAYYCSVTAGGSGISIAPGQTMSFGIAHYSGIQIPTPGKYFLSVSFKIGTEKYRIDSGLLEYVISGEAEK